MRPALAVPLAALLVAACSPSTPALPSGCTGALCIDASVVVDRPAVDASVTDVPVVDAPVVDVPTVVDVPAVVDAPVVDAPVVDAPVVDVPTVVDVPVVDVPTVIDVPPVVDIPSVDAGTPRRRAFIGVFRPSDRSWTLDGCGVDRCLPAFGVGDLPLVGDWSGTGRTAIGTYHRSDLQFTLDTNGNGTFDGCSVDRCITGYGVSGDLPVAGDWAGTGRSAIGVFRPSDRSFGLDRSNDGIFESCTVDVCVGSFGETGVQPIVGDWAGLGRTAVGIFRPSNQTWTFDLNDNTFFDGCTVDRCFGTFGTAGDLPVTGDWSGDGRAKIGIFRPSTGGWVLDANGNGAYDGCPGDTCVTVFGQNGDLPVAGAW